MYSDIFCIYVLDTALASGTTALLWNRLPIKFDYTYY
jgi:hypothetical protein